MPTTDGGNAVPAEKPYSLVYLDTCKPDFFAGYSGYSYAVSLPAFPRVSDVLQGLLQEITRTEVFPDTRSERVYDELRCSAVCMFEGFDKRNYWSPRVSGLAEYFAYFGVIEGTTV